MQLPVRAQRGFTLVEVLVAFAILMFVVMMSLAAFLERNRRLQQAREIVLAYQSLANEAEFRKRMAWEGLEATPETFVSDTALLAPLAPYTASVTVVPGEQGVKHVTMFIRWQDGRREASLGLVRVRTGGATLW
jgi:prepilin-type N-terminal cleavage/methylation domain-containing protein